MISRLPNGGSAAWTFAKKIGDLILSWEEPWDESGIYGYRIYMDGKPVYADEDDYFNHVTAVVPPQKPAIEFQELILKPLIPLK